MVQAMKLVCHINTRDRLIVRSARSAFTLIELIVVMGIMVIMMVAGMASYRGIRRGAELKGAESILRTTLMLARQQAVMLRQDVQVTLVREPPGSSDSTNSIRISTGGSLIHSPTFLPSAIEFDDPPPVLPAFKSSGSAVASAAIPIVLREKSGMGQTLGTVTNTLWPLTGITQ